jgi:raffinose/stachyose/melibiose transport system substrate-binding protein
MDDKKRAEELRSEFEARREWRRQIGNRIGFVILVLAMGWSVTHVMWLAFFAPGESVVSDKIVIRFAHWQLEGRTVEALNEACEDYMKLNPDVVVKQIEVPERGYEQWTKTQLIGRTAPDLIELRTQKWKTIINRYFEPLAVYVDKPNPYNADDPNLAEVPWRETYVDGMMGGWISDLKALYGMPMSLFTVRIYANKQMLEEATGSSTPPRTLGEFIRTCRQIEAWAEETDRNVVPISGSDYIAQMFRNRYFKMATWGLLDVLDRNHDGSTSETERLRGVYSGRLDLSEDPHIEAAHKVLFDITRFFNKGFMAAKRDQSVFLFVQQNAAMIATGSWEAGTLWEQTKGQFDITVFDFPTAKPGNSQYGKYIRYRVNEADAHAGFSMGLTKLSQHKDTAIDFMHFLTSRSYNEKLNRKFRWFPAILGAKPDRVLEPFRPQVEGVYEVWKMNFGGKSQLEYENDYSNYISEAGVKNRDQHYQQFIENYEEDYKRLALEDFERNHQKKYSSMEANKATVAQMRRRAVLSGMDGRISGDNLRNLQAVVHGQAKQAHTLPTHAQDIEEIKAMIEDGTGEKDSNGNGEAGGDQ